MPETPNCSLLVTVALSLSCAITAQEPLPRIVLNGRVVDVLGTGIPIADVRVLDLDDGALLGRFTCDGDGHFRVKVPERTAYLVRGAADGFATCNVELSPVGGDLALVRGYKLHGRIVDADGAPQAGVQVATTTGSRVVARPEPVRTITDERGHFELRGVPNGFNEVFARRLDGTLLYAMPRVTGDSELLLGPPAAMLRLPVGLLPTPAAAADAIDAGPPPEQGHQDLAFAVRMVGPDSQPLTGLVVMAQVEGCHAFQLARCNTYGVATFAEPLPEGSRVVVSSRDQHWAVDQPQRPTTRLPRQPAEGCPVTVSEQPTVLLALPACQVTVIVQDPDGKPSAGVVVHLEWERGKNGTFRTFRSVRTDDEGRAIFTGLHPRLGRMRAFTAGARGFAVADAFTIPAERREATLSLQSNPATVVTGTVLDVDGTPRAATSVMLRCEEQCFSSSTLSDIDGRYRLLGPGGHAASIDANRTGSTFTLPVGAPLQRDVQMARN